MLIYSLVRYSPMKCDIPFIEEYPETLLVSCNLQHVLDTFVKLSGHQLKADAIPTIMEKIAFDEYLPSVPPIGYVLYGISYNDRKAGNKENIWELHIWNDKYTALNFQKGLYNG